MKATILIAIFILGLTTIVPAYKDETVTLRVGQQKKAARGNITIKFIRVVEDSRPPEGSMGVWAGNAKLEIRITDRRGSKTAIINTTLGPKGDQYGGYAINLVSLSPERQGPPIKPSSYRAVFSVTKLYR